MNKKRNHKTTIITSVILMVAIGGLAMFDINPADAVGQADIISPSEAAQVEATTDFPVSAPLGAVLKMVSALVVVVICIYGAIYLLKRMMHGRDRQKSREAILEVIESTHVGPKKMVSLIRVADRSVLIGVTDTQVSVLTEIDADETAVILARESAVEESAGFGQFLGGAADKLRRFTSGRTPTTQEG